ncbi:MAG TPA: HisA/HisF-related TIM barrel protein [Methanosarcina sp.]|nr:HisA/HisF-related TIM barrel protein [Methanosarcina sp.]
MRKRLIPCLFLKNGMIIRSEKFHIHQIIGNPLNELERFSDWAVDEIIYIDISQSHHYDTGRDDHKVTISGDRFELIREISRRCFVPLGFGGGIRTLKDIEMILKYGADKVVLNTVLFHEPEFLSKAANIFGSQALTACIDYRDGYVFHTYGTVNSGWKVLDWCKNLAQNGIGEVILQDIDRDGTARGYDTKTITEIVSYLDVPIIALSGAGDYYDFVECFQEAAPSAVAAGNIFHFREHSDYHIKKMLAKYQIDIRKTWED